MGHLSFSHAEARGARSFHPFDGGTPKVLPGLERGGVKRKMFIGNQHAAWGSYGSKIFKLN